MPDVYNNYSKTILFTIVLLKLYNKQDAKNVLAILQINFKSYFYMRMFEFRIMLAFRKKEKNDNTQN